MAEMTGKVALVTGAGSGIGRASAVGFAQRGARVIVTDVDEQGGQETVRLVKEAGSDGLFVRVDVTKAADIEAAVKAAVDHYQRLDYAVNSAGIGGAAALVGDYPEDQWRLVIDINLTGVFLGMKAEIQQMLKQGGGAIVNLASILGLVAFEGSPAYVASKHGVVGLTKAAALEYSARGIRANAVCPGFIATSMTKQLREDEAVNQMLIKKHPMGRLGTAEEVAALVLWLCSDAASFVSGGTYEVDGGYLTS